ncbi:MAG: hypothetical protein WC400_03320 [Patescibacteria group bacterium]|jgi:hypothetical protein
MISPHEQFFVGMPEDAGGTNPDIAGKKPFVFAEVNPELIQTYETAALGGRIKAFGRFLQAYIKHIGSIEEDDGSAQVEVKAPEGQESLLDKAQRDRGTLDSKRRYIDSANRLDGLVSMLIDPDLDLTGIADDISVTNVVDLVKTNGDVRFLIMDIQKIRGDLADPAATEEKKSPYRFAVLGQKKRILSFYEEAKRHFFPEIPSVEEGEGGVAQANGGSEQ